MDIAFSFFSVSKAPDRGPGGRGTARSPGDCSVGRQPMVFERNLRSGLPERLDPKLRPTLRDSRSPGGKPVIRVVGKIPPGPGIIVVTPAYLSSRRSAPGGVSSRADRLGCGSGIHGKPVLEVGALADAFPDGGDDLVSFRSKIFRNAGSRPTSSCRMIG